MDAHYNKVVKIDFEKDAADMAIEIFNAYKYQVGNLTVEEETNVRDEIAKYGNDFSQETGVVIEESNANLIKLLKLAKILNRNKNQHAMETKDTMVATDFVIPGQELTSKFVKDLKYVVFIDRGGQLSLFPAAKKHREIFIGDRERAEAYIKGKRSLENTKQEIIDTYAIYKRIFETTPIPIEEVSDKGPWSGDEEIAYGSYIIEILGTVYNDIKNYDTIISGLNRNFIDETVFVVGLEDLLKNVTAFLDIKKRAQINITSLGNLSTLIPTTFIRETINTTNVITKLEEINIASFDNLFFTSFNDEILSLNEWFDGVNFSTQMPPVLQYCDAIYANLTQENKIVISTRINNIVQNLATQRVLKGTDMEIFLAGIEKNRRIYEKLRVIEKYKTILGTDTSGFDAFLAEENNYIGENDTDVKKYTKDLTTIKAINEEATELENGKQAIVENINAARNRGELDSAFDACQAFNLRLQNLRVRAIGVDNSTTNILTIKKGILDKLVNIDCPALNATMLKKLNETRFNHLANTILEHIQTMGTLIPLIENTNLANIDELSKRLEDLENNITGMKSEALDLGIDGGNERMNALVIPDYSKNIALRKLTLIKNDVDSEIEKIRQYIERLQNLSIKSENYRVDLSSIENSCIESIKIIEELKARARVIIVDEQDILTLKTAINAIEIPNIKAILDDKSQALALAEKNNLREQINDITAQINTLVEHVQTATNIEALRLLDINYQKLNKQRNDLSAREGEFNIVSDTLTALLTLQNFPEKYEKRIKEFKDDQEAQKIQNRKIEDKREEGLLEIKRELEADISLVIINAYKMLLQRYIMQITEDMRNLANIESIEKLKTDIFSARPINAEERQKILQEIKEARDRYEAINYVKYNEIRKTIMEIKQKITEKTGQATSSATSI